MSNRTEITLSVVVPVYGCAPCLVELHRRVFEALEAVPGQCELILVDDRAGDGAWAVIQDICKKDDLVRGIRLSRNFGQHFAITAGLEYARGEHVVVMDCDLQDDPIYIRDMYQKAMQGYEIVFTRKHTRRHSWLKNIAAKIYTKVFNFLTDDVRNYEEVGSYSLISQKVAEQFLRIEDRHRHYLLILRWLGFDSTYIDVEHQPRATGKSSYSFGRLMTFALDGITSQSTRLLRLTVAMGAMFVGISLLGILLLVALYMLRDFQDGWASIVVLILFSTGLILFSIGIAGIYVGNIFDQVRNRPLYVIQEVLNGYDSTEE